MEEILNIIIKLAGALVGVFAVWVLNSATNYLKGKLTASEQEQLRTFISALVAAAEQLYRAEDPDGNVRLGYVQGMLIEAGYDLTDAVRALIESEVYSLNSNKPLEIIGQEVTTNE